jgi:glutamate-1-semialdehyde 2,1-aminomutase
MSLTASAKGKPIDDARSDPFIPGGVLGTFIPPNLDVAVAVSARGSHITLSDGSDYLDYVMGSGPMIAGHANPAVVQAIAEQAARGTQYYIASPSALALAAKIVSAAPCAERVKFTSTGAEATFQALRLARSYTGRTTILRFRGAYHGHHDYGMFGNSAGIPPEVGGTLITAEFNDQDGLSKAFDDRGDEIAAVIVEPIQRSTPPAPGFLRRVVELARAHGAVSVFDEVVTGFRIAWGGAQEAFDVVPDLAAYGKIIGGGMPLAAVAGRAEILDLADPHRLGSDDRYVYFSGTLNGNPLAATAGLTTLGILEQPGAYEYLGSLGELLSNGLRSRAQTLGIPLAVTCDGPMVGVAFSDGDVLAPDTFLRADKKRLKRLEGELFKRKVLTNLSAKMYLSLAHTEAEIERTLDIFADALSDMAE